MFDSLTNERKEQLKTVGKGVLAFIVLVLAFIGVMCIWPWGFETMDPSLTGLDCDIRIGCNGRAIPQGEVSNILLERAQQLERPVHEAYANGRKEGFDLSLYQPGVDRPYDSVLMVDRKLRAENTMENMTGRSHSDYVFQQFGNDGTIINPAINTLMSPSKSILQ